VMGSREIDMLRSKTVGRGQEAGRRAVVWCEYVYDFGDDWVHKVKLLRVVSEPAILPPSAV